jgi:hypothetical protein
MLEEEKYIQNKSENKIEHLPFAIASSPIKQENIKN